MTNATCNEPDCDNPTRISAHGRSTKRCDVHASDKASKTVGKRCRWCGKDYRTNDSTGSKGNKGCCSSSCGNLWSWSNGHTRWQGPRVCRINWSQCVTCMRWFTFKPYCQHTCSSQCHAGLVDVLDEWARSRVYSADCAWCGKYFYSRQPSATLCSSACRRRRERMRRNARQRQAPGEYTWTQVMRLFILGGKRCAYCDEVIEGQPDPDHVIPLSRGGSNSIVNILPACRACNGDKSDHALDEWLANRARRGLSLRRVEFDSSGLRFRHLVLGRIAERDWPQVDSERAA